MPNNSTRIRIPKHRLHKPSGQAVVTIAGRDFYLVQHGTQISRHRYKRLCDERLASDGTSLQPAESMTVDGRISASLRYETDTVGSLQPRWQPGRVLRDT